MSDASSTLRRTPLYSQHIELGAKMVPFAGWEMPVQYHAGLKEEHQRVRNHCGLFDVSHMGEILISGPDALQALQYLTCNDINKISEGQAQYSALLNPEGGVVDDIIVYSFGDNEFLLCVNAGNSQTAYSWLKNAENKFNLKVQDVSENYSQIAVQGPKSYEVLTETLGAQFETVSSKPPFTFQRISIFGAECIVARTGYTGEEGVEIFVAPEIAVQTWNALLQAKDVLPCGLGARDTLRLEVCYPLHGHELLPNRSALQSGLGWIVKFDKGEFIGSQALEAEKESGVSHGLVAFELVSQGIARENVQVVDISTAGEESEPKEIGVVTSGTITPSLGKACGMAIVEKKYVTPGSKIGLLVRGRVLEAVVVKKPLYQRA